MGGSGILMSGALVRALMPHFDACRAAWHSMSAHSDMRVGQCAGWKVKAMTGVDTCLRPSLGQVGARSLQVLCYSSWHLLPSKGFDSRVCGWYWQMLSFSRPRDYGPIGLKPLVSMVPANFSLR